MNLRSITAIGFALLSTAALCLGDVAGSAVRYTISFPNAVHHEARVEAIFAGVPASQALEVRMARSSPGRYALHEFARNVYAVTARDGKGRPLEIRREAPDRWSVAGHDGTVAFTYTLFADYGDGTYSQIDESHAHLNMPATFVWAPALAGNPVELRLQLPPDSRWKVATQLTPAEDPNVYRARDLAYFLDSPVEASSFDLREFRISEDGKPVLFQLALHHAGSGSDAAAMSQVVEAIVRESRAIFGAFPLFDYGRYTFLADYLPYVHGDGMEHRNSTICTGTTPLSEGAARAAGTIAHEFFHAWNVERLRPASLEPFDFTRVNVSAELWFAEGFTSYYTALITQRAGITGLDRFAEFLGRSLDAILNSPAREMHSPSEMSRRASFHDPAYSMDPVNSSNTFISYYTYGAMLGAGLDLTLRTRFPGRDLDQYMRLLWNRFGSAEKPYTAADLKAALADLTEDPEFARDFFAQHIDGTQPIDYAPLLEQAGFVPRKTNPNSAWLGPVSWKIEQGRLTLAARTRRGTPLYEAGMDIGAQLVSIDREKPGSEKELARLLKKKKPGDRVEIRFERRGVARTASLQLSQDPALEVVPFEKLHRELSPEVRKLREEWLASKAGGELPSLTRYCPKCRRSFPFADEFCRHDGQTLRLSLADSR